MSSSKNPISIFVKFFRFSAVISFFFILFLSAEAHSQSFTQLMEFADQKVAEGDYYYAIQYYEQAMKIDSNSVEVLWKYAEALRMYKDYPKAENYYLKVYKKEEAKIYPMSIFWLATMEHINGKYLLSMEHWKEAKKVYKKDREGYLYLKSQQEIKSCLWASKAVRDTTDYILEHLPEPVNSKDAEFAPFFHDNKMYFTSLKAD
ncbi:MAG: tetratricopeptide repeat protein, partial [Crocinitomicaceae bacterium]|nr:tetratricopeptide repeat protein [Crocinitomicaceae bacterium]